MIQNIWTESREVKNTYDQIDEQSQVITYMLDNDLKQDLKDYLLKLSNVVAEEFWDKEVIQNSSIKNYIVYSSHAVYWSLEKQYNSRKNELPLWSFAVLKILNILQEI